MRFRTRTQDVADVLIGMVQQHTEALDDGSYGHSFMRADEDAFDVLVEYGYATYVTPDNPYAIRFVDEPTPDLVRTIDDYNALPGGTILEVESVKKTGTNIFPGSVLVVREHSLASHRDVWPGLHLWAGEKWFTKECLFGYAETLSVVRLGEGK